MRAQVADGGSVFPAPAGINRQNMLQAAAEESVPRASGDKPGLLGAIVTGNACSPRQRG
ncbi:hypothetical protein G5Y01_004177 [Salmonella enterica subsp. enterica]|nr:hypothetical protein [Salmonella enterica subsp. enterica serovar Kintambo]